LAGRDWDLKKIVVFGEALIDFVPGQRGVPLKDVDSYHRRAGGAPANVAAAIGKWGGTVSFIGQVGQDAFGQHIREVLAAHRVDLTHLRMHPEYPTALAFVTLTAEGERDFVFVRKKTADLMLRQEEIDLEAFSSGFLFHLGSNLFMEEGAYSLSVYLLEASKRHLEAAARKLASRGPSLLIVTLGERGCYYVRGEQSGYVESIPASPVDTTGAGDAFIGGFLYRLAADEDGRPQKISAETLERYLRFANAAGAMTTERMGAIDGLPSLADVKRRMEEHF
jgi:fructokinase